MNKQYRTYTKEFKVEALEVLKTSGKNAAQLERDLGITKGLLLKWRDHYQVQPANGDTRLAPSDMAAAQAEIRRLRRELVVAEQERDILKKAVSIFSKLER
ncbi:MAG: transposase [Anaerolineae bacterium]|nr:transposase [Anaerolineae bacterium]